MKSENPYEYFDSYILDINDADISNYLFSFYFYNFYTKIINEFIFLKDLGNDIIVSKVEI